MADQDVQVSESGGTMVRMDEGWETWRPPPGWDEPLTFANDDVAPVES